MSNSTFTMRHYIRIHELIKSTIQGFESDSNMISDEDINYVAGMRTIHDKIGIMFQKDNARFNPQLWKL